MPPVRGRSPGYQIQNQNPLLPTYPGNLGGKTGFTDAARHTFVTAAERDGRRLVVSVMDTENVPAAGRRPGRPAARLGLRASRPAPTASGRLVEPGRPAAWPPPTDRRAADPRRRGRGAAAAPAGRRRTRRSPLVPRRWPPAPRSSWRRRWSAAAGRCGVVPVRPACAGRLRRPGGDAASIRRRVAVHAAVKKEKRATRLIQTSRPTAPPNAEAVTLSEISDR